MVSHTLGQTLPIQCQQTGDLFLTGRIGQMGWEVTVMIPLYPMTTVKGFWDAVKASV